MTRRSGRPPLRLAALTALAALAVTVEAASPRADFKLVRATELPNLGLKIRIMSGAREAPPPATRTFTYEGRKGEERIREERYEPADLWRQEQFAAAWVDEDSNTLTIASVHLPLPTGFRQKHCSRDEYAAAAAGTGAGTAWTPEALAQWAADYLDARPVAAAPVARRPTALSDLVALSPEGKWNQIAYAFRLNRAASGQSRAPTNWFFCCFDVNRKVPSDKARETVLRDFFGSLGASRAAAAPAAGPAQSFQAKPTGGKLSAAPRSPAFLASRQQVADSIRNLTDWWYAETDHYIILANLKPSFRVLIKELQTDIAAIRPAYSRTVPERVPIDAISVIRVIADQADYVNYVGATHKWTGGVWMPDKKELVIRAQELAGGMEQRREILRVACHEAFHQYLFYALDHVETAAWFNEGHAGFFETADIASRRFEIRESEGHSKKTEELILAGKARLEPLMRMSYPTFYNDEREDHYALAWALVYYLRKGTPTGQPPENAGILERYVDLLWASRKADKATEELLASLKMEPLQSDFEDFWKSGNRRGAARRNDLFKDLAP